MALTTKTRTITVDEYDRMIEDGTLTENDRVELLDGVIEQMSPIGKRHAACVNRLDYRLQRRLGDGYIVGVQNPFQLSNLSEPQPDLVVLRFRDDFYERILPIPADVLLIIEVSESSLEYDRMRKLPLYARDGIPEVWIVDLTTDTIFVFTGLVDGTYLSVQTFRRGDIVASTAFPQLALRVEDVLG